MELKGSKTEKNLMEAFAGESQARNKRAKETWWNKIVSYRSNYLSNYKKLSNNNHKVIDKLYELI